MFLRSVLFVILFSTSIFSQTQIPIRVMPISGSNPAALEAQTVMSSALRDSYAVLSRKNLKLDAKLSQMSQVLSPRFDFDVMTKLAVGKTYWMTLTPQQQTELTTAFKAYLEDLYLVQLAKYDGETLIIYEPIVSGSKVSLDLEVKSKETSFRITFKLYVKNGQYKVYDVEVKGVSTIQTFSTQFKQYLSSNRYSELIRVLKTK